MKFLNYLNRYENENTSEIKKIIKEKKEKINTIIKEAFFGDFVSKEEAKILIENDVLDSKNIDVDFMKEHKKDIINTIESLTEGEIKIIIHNNEPGSKSNGGRRGRPANTSNDVTDIDITTDDDEDDVILDVTEDSPKKKRGRPKKDTKLESKYKKNKVIKEAVEGDGVNKAYELVDEGLISKEDLYNIFTMYIGRSDSKEFLENICRHYDLEEDEVNDVDDLIDYIGIDSAFSEILRWMTNDEIIEALEMNELLPYDDEDIDENLVTEEDDEDEEKELEDELDDEEEGGELDDEELKWSDIEARLDAVEDKVDQLLPDEELEDAEEELEDAEEELE
ncbi:MAG: hypothetical protein ACOCZ5_01285, partial [bacterium]